MGPQRRKFYAVYYLRFTMCLCAIAFNPEKNRVSSCAPAPLRLILKKYKRNGAEAQ